MAVRLCFRVDALGHKVLILKISDEGYPVQPYGVEDNPYSILDVADIVFITRSTRVTRVFYPTKTAKCLT